MKIHIFSLHYDKECMYICIKRSCKRFLIDNSNRFLISLFQYRPGLNIKLKNRKESFQDTCAFLLRFINIRR